MYTPGWRENDIENKERVTTLDSAARPCFNNWANDYNGENPVC